MRPQKLTKIQSNQFKNQSDIIFRTYLKSKKTELPIKILARWKKLDFGIEFGTCTTTGSETWRLEKRFGQWFSSNCSLSLSCWKSFSSRISSLIIPRKVKKPNLSVLKSPQGRNRESSMARTNWKLKYCVKIIQNHLLYD